MIERDEGLDDGIGWFSRCIDAQNMYSGTYMIFGIYTRMTMPTM